MSLWACAGCTSFQNLLDLDVVGAEAAVEFEVIGVVEKRSSERKQQLLNTNKRREWIKRINYDGLIITFRQNIKIRTKVKGKVNETKDLCEYQRGGYYSPAESWRENRFIHLHVYYHSGEWQRSNWTFQLRFFPQICTVKVHWLAGTIPWARFLGIVSYFLISTPSYTLLCKTERKTSRLIQFHVFLSPLW